MKSTLFAIALAALTGLAAPAMAESKSDLFGRCIGETLSDDATEECVALRINYRSQVRDCMATLKAAAGANASSNGATSAVGTRARFLICSARARETFAGIGQ